MGKSAYIFTSERLGFRLWENNDLEKMSAINASKKVMKYFPNVQSKADTQSFMERMNASFQENKYCYFAVDVLETKEFIGFIGLCNQTFESTFTPNIDIGWRLHYKHWNKGYATEGAKACLEYAKENLCLVKIIAIAPQVNEASEKVMQKIGMKKVGIVKHPLLKNDKVLEPCVLYELRLKH